MKTGFQGGTRAVAAIMMGLVASAAPGHAAIRGLAGMALGMDQDSLVAAATQGGYSLTLNQGSILYFVPRDSSAAAVHADLVARRVSALTFEYPLIPTAEEFAAKELEFSDRFGPPDGAQDGDSSRIVLWQEGNSRLVLKAGFNSRRGIPFTARFLDLMALGATDSTANSPTNSAKKPVHSRKVHSRTHPKAGPRK